MNDNYFSWGNLNEMADIQSHIEFADTIFKKYNWDKSVRRALQKNLDAIVAKQNDKTLNISVIGEFATGKSSFINAIVGYELLAVNVLQGTTVAITIIEYDDKYSITLVDDNNESSIYEYDSIDYLRDALQHYTTDPEFSNTVNYVKVTLPSDALKKGFRIIDTPGTNSLEQWHEDITRRAINDISDLSIILMDSSRPMPETLINFIDSTLRDSVKDSLFIANKIDVIRIGEREMILNYIRKKVDLSFDMEGSVVLPFSSFALTNDYFSKDVQAIDENSKQLTFESLQFIFSCTAYNRIRAQARKLLHLIENLYESLNVHVNNIAKKFQEELNNLEQSRQADFMPFISRQIALRQKRFVSSVQEKKTSIEIQADKLVNAAIENINSKIDSHTGSTLDDLSTYIKGGEITTDIKTEGAKIATIIEQNYAKIKPLYKSQLLEFQIDFEKEFKKLKVLPIKLNVTPKEINVTRSSHSANIGPIASIISEELSKENWAFGGGLAAGAAIGTAIFPGVGTAIGALVGLFAGAGVAPDVEQVKQNIKSKLNIPLKSYYRSICADCLANFSGYINDVNKSIETEINRYYSTYNTEIQKRINNWEADYDKVYTNIQRTKIELADINNRKSLIENIILQINN